MGLGTEKYNQVEYIRTKYSIPLHRFLSGIIYASEIVDGTKPSEAYTVGFGCTAQEARGLATQIRQTKWMQELISALEPDESTMYYGHKKKIIVEGMKVVHSGKQEDKIAAMRALAPYLAIGKKKEEADADVGKSAAIEAIAQFVGGLNQISNNNKMIGRDGKIIDVDILE